MNQVWCQAICLINLSGEENYQDDFTDWRILSSIS